MAKVLYFQEGGSMQQTATDPQAQLQAMLQQYAQSRDPQLAVQICDMLIQAMGASQQQADPAAQQQAQPAYKNGGKVSNKLSAVDKLKAHRASLEKK